MKLRGSLFILPIRACGCWGVFLLFFFQFLSNLLIFSMPHREIYHHGTIIISCIEKIFRKILIYKKKIRRKNGYSKSKEAQLNRPFRGYSQTLIFKKKIFICFNDSSSKINEKCFFFHLKSSFRSQDI